MQAYPVRHEALGLVLRGAALDADRGAAAHVIEEVVAIIDLGKPEERQQLAVEGARLVPLADRQDDVRHAVPFDHAFSLVSVVSTEAPLEYLGVTSEPSGPTCLPQYA